MFRLRADLALVNTADFFPPIVDDPYSFGRIAAANALGDIYAMGARPLTAVNLVGFPCDSMDKSVLTEILRGGAERVEAAGAVVVGGHTIADAELKYGLALTGVVHPQRFVRNGGARAGDLLVLTKPLGTGIVCAGIKQRVAEPGEEKFAVASMVALNDAAGGALLRYQASACTDITGFGLAGHAFEMASASKGVRLEFEADALPLLPGTARLAEAGCLTGGSRRTREFLGAKLSLPKHLMPAVAQAVIDPQTSGGLLVSLPEKTATAYIKTLHDKGVRSAVVGRVAARSARSPVLVRVE